MSQTQLPSPYRRGAEDGLYFGLYLLAMFFAGVYVNGAAMLSLLWFLMLIGVPVVIYIFLRRAFRADYGCSQMSALWMHGIMIFLCGGLIAAAGEIAWLRWIHPTFIVETLHTAIDVYTSLGTPEAEQVAEILQKMIDNQAIPSSMSMVMGMFWLTVFSGSLLSALVALLVRARPVNQKPS